MGSYIQSKVAASTPGKPAAKPSPPPPPVKKPKHPLMPSRKRGNPRTANNNNNMDHGF